MGSYVLKKHLIQCSGTLAVSDSDEWCVRPRMRDSGAYANVSSHLFDALHRRTTASRTGMKIGGKLTKMGTDTPPEGHSNDKKRTFP